ncbi:hypothetical protein CAEBREN_10264 [Caenorhabditis brenneri]|uniref:DUF38 domain-containing protein n=1 Tax=Caenorhabditis brenneri TaxID=135651 RepID=G0PED6_CAEBE|nr:hypothetical protein CAEBREN_10264 [Caenorhabditis brenneri]
MNQSNVPHSEVGLRLTICKEFLTDEKKPIEELYGSWMRRIGGKLIEFEEFEYWYRRFQNNQFDLGYDTSLDEKENPEIESKIDKVENLDSETENVAVIPKETISEIQNAMSSEASEAIIEKEVPLNAQKNIECKIDEAEESVDGEEETPVLVVEEKCGTDMTAVIPDEIAPAVHKNTDYRFDVQNVSAIFQELINEKVFDFISLNFDTNYTLQLGDFYAFWQKSYTSPFLPEKQDVVWTLHYGGIKVQTVDPEKSVIDHLWFVLKNPNIKLKLIRICASKTKLLEKYEEVDYMLQSMFDSFDHQIPITQVFTYNLLAKTNHSLLKRVKPGTLEFIDLNNPYRYQELEETVKLDQWKQAIRICSTTPTSVTFDDVSHCTFFSLAMEEVTPEDVVRVRDVRFSPDSVLCQKLLQTFEIVKIILVTGRALTPIFKARPGPEGPLCPENYPEFQKIEKNNSQNLCFRVILTSSTVVRVFEAFNTILINFQC